MEENHHFAISSNWDPNEREGRLQNPDGTFITRFTGAPSLGGKGGATNPEELLLSAVEACYVQTWAIFLKKLKVPIENPRLEGTCEMDKDPAGGYRITRIDLRPHVPRPVWETQQADVEKTLNLGEKYCIVSKAVKSEGLTLTVTPKIVEG